MYVRLLSSVFVSFLFVYDSEPSRLIFYIFSAFRNVWGFLMVQGFLCIFLMYFTEN